MSFYPKPRRVLKARMNTTPIIYTNRLNSTKSSINKHAYKLSVIKIPRLLTSKEELTSLLVSTVTYTSTIDIKTDTDFNELCKNNIICPSVFHKGVCSKLDSDVKVSNFIFIDIDKGLTIDEACRILDKEHLSYLLFTSSSHSNVTNKFHILVPLLKSVDSKEDYKAYWSYLHQLFDCKTDRACCNPSRACYPSLNTNMEIINRLFRNDLHLDTKVLNEYKKVEIEITKTESFFNIEVSKEFLDSLHQLNPNLIIQESAPKFIKFKRDLYDRVGNVLYYIDQNKKVLFDISKDTRMDLLFSNEEFEDNILANDSRDSIQEAIKNDLLEHFGTKEKMIECGLTPDNKTIIIANEGVGKSETIISLCQEQKIIYAAHTIKRIEEIKASFVQKEIDFVVCCSNEEIFREFELDETLISSYKEACSKGITTVDFIEEVFIDNKDLKESLLKRIMENNNLLLRKDCNVIITIAKLKRLLLRFIKEINLSTIVLDEFEASDFYSFTTEPFDNKGTLHNCLYSEVQITVYKNKFNLMNLLKLHSVIILSTERTKIERIFYNNKDYSIKDHSRWLKARNVIYKLVHSTSGMKKDDIKIRDLVIQNVKTLYPFIDEVIVNASDEGTVNHLQVRGSNDYSEKNTLVIATKPCPQEQKLFELNCKDFYKDKELRHIQNDINSTLMSCQINQSIGRNSGFREREKSCVVVLPILAPNSDNCFREISLDLTYISSNTNYLEGF